MRRSIVEPRRLKVIKDLIQISKKIYQKNLTIGKSGNISCRLSDNIIAIKKTGRSLSNLKPKDFAIVDILGETPSEVSSDYFIHREIYLLSKEVKFVLHSHPQNLVKYTIKNRDNRIVPTTYEGKIYFGDEIKIVRIKHDKLIEELPNHIKKGFIIEAGHGLYIFSNDLNEMIYLLEELEYIATLQL